MITKYLYTLLGQSLPNDKGAAIFFGEVSMITKSTRDIICIVNSIIFTVNIVISVASNPLSNCFLMYKKNINYLQLRHRQTSIPK